jgi:hypothetical protein
LESQSDSTALVLAGGWELAVLADLRALSGPEPVVLGLREVPGLLAIELDLDAYRRAVAGTPAGVR